MPVYATPGPDILPRANRFHDAAMAATDRPTAFMPQPLPMTGRAAAPPALAPITAPAATLPLSTTRTAAG